MDWPEAAARLAASRNYWLGTTMPSGAPHAAPVWGVVAGRTLYLYSERSTVKARNIAADPRVVVHLESGDDVLIVRGTAEDLGSPARTPIRTSTWCTRSARGRPRPGGLPIMTARSAAGPGRASGIGRGLGQ